MTDVRWCDVCNSGHPADSDNCAVAMNRRDPLPPGWYRQMPVDWRPPRDFSDGYFECEWDGKIYVHEGVLRAMGVRIPECT